jgi:tRNA(Ile)-lysidine synthase
LEEQVPDGKTSATVRKVLDFIRSEKMVSRGEKLLVAVSGGPDSVCLLYILKELREKLGIELHIAHLDHRLRRKDAAADARYVAALARRLGIPATIESRDVKTYRKENRLSLEEAAREVRYSFLTQVARAVGASRVAVGHTADDHIETVLMHLLRGSGTRGLRGLLPVSQLKTASGNLTVVRPLLGLTREETEDYCRQLRLRPRTDTSNQSPDLFRNRIRRYLLPQLCKYNPQIAGALRRSANIAAADFAFIDGEIGKYWDKIVREQKGAAIIDKKGLGALPPALKRYLLLRAVESVLGSLKDIGAGHIEDMLDALPKPAGKMVGLPFGLSFIVEYDRYILTRNPESLCPLPPLENEIALNIPGRTRLSGWRIEAAVLPASTVTAVNARNEEFSAYFDFTRTGDRLSVRPRRPDDRFQPLGMDQPKKLNRFMIDARIPRLWRRLVPVVASPEQVIWVVGHRIDERVKITGATSKVLRLEFRRD